MGPTLNKLAGPVTKRQMQEVLLYNGLDSLFEAMLAEKQMEAIGGLSSAVEANPALCIG